VLLGAFGALGVASPALAAPPQIVTTPTISGNAWVGVALDSTDGSVRNASSSGKLWLTCSSATDEGTCTIHWDEWHDHYTVQPSDINKYLRVALWADASNYSPVWKVGTATAKVTAAPTPTPTPTKTPTPTPTPTKTPTPTPTATKTATPTPSQPVTTPAPTAPPVITATPTPTAQPLPPSTGGGSAAPATTTSVAPTRSGATGQVLGATDRTTANVMIKPFPVVRISGRLTAGGARVSVLTVKVPKGVSVTVRCSGRGCPMRQLAHASALWHAKAFETELRAGTKLTVTISKPGYISKVTTIQIRRGAAPLRSDKCRLPGTRKLRTCPKR
jgi:hypothetical protein